MGGRRPVWRTLAPPQRAQQKLTRFGLPPLLEAVLVLAELAVLVRVLLRPHREPASRLAWVIIVIAVPLLGIVAYLILGETRISGPRRARGRDIDERLPRPRGHEPCLDALKSSPHDAPFALARTINGLDPTCTNSARVVSDSNAAIDEMVRDIDTASRHVHLCTYIWLADSSGLRIKEACIRAAARGVRVRILADALGSWRLIRSPHWGEMRQRGCDVRVALPVGNPLWTLIRGRVDLRNHRKLLILDNRIAWCGSQNLADREFRIKRRYAPWVDIMSRWDGAVAQHCQFLFVSDWIAEGGDDVSALLAEPPTQELTDEGIIAQVIGTGPTGGFDAMPACFSELIHSAREELVVTTPYFVPDEQLLFALTSAARRGVRTIMAIPRRCDSRVVAGTAQSYYPDLIKAGVEVYEFGPGLLHAKTMIADRSVGLIGSANLDRRSFELNFENNILFADRALARAVRDCQAEYLASSIRVTLEDVARFGIIRRLWQNLLATMSPVL